MRILAVTWALIGIAMLAPSGAWADAAAGKAKFDAACSECHEPSDFAGKAPDKMKHKLPDMVNGTTKHKGHGKALTPAEADDLVAYFGTLKK